MLNSRPVALNTEGSSNMAYARTPARGLLKNRGALQENAVYMGSMTGNAKGKASILQTPFRPSTRKAMQTQKPVFTMHKPLGDKTPFPNRQLPMQTPAPQAAKLGKLAMLDPDLAKTPGALLLPSTRRKSLRLPRSAGKKFTTPVQQGNHWDVSDGELDADVSTNTAEAQDVEVEDYDEIEYMPPKIPEQPYEPLFDLPDYKEVGKTILEIAHSDLYDDTADLYYSTPIDLQIDMEELLTTSGGFDVDMLPLPELDSDDEDLIFPSLDTEPNTPPGSAMSQSPRLHPLAHKPTATTTTRSSRADSVTRNSRPMTRAASRALEDSRAPTPTMLAQRPHSSVGMTTRSMSRTGSGLAGRATPSGEQSTSRPGTSAGIRALLVNTTRQPSTTRERMPTRSSSRTVAAGASKASVMHTQSSESRGETKRTSSRAAALADEDLDLLLTTHVRSDDLDDFEFKL